MQTKRSQLLSRTVRINDEVFVLFAIGFRTDRGMKKQACTNKTMSTTFPQSE